MVVDERTAVSMLRRTVAVFALALFASTWRLWTPHTAFPRVPLFSFAGHIPNVIDWLAFGVELVAMATVLFANASSKIWRYGCAAFVVAFTTTVLMDQHRLQPWGYQFALILAALALVPDQRGLTLARLLTIGVYLHSALSKFDASFFESQGPYLVGGLTQLAGVEFDRWNPSQLRFLVALLPIGELLIAIGFCFRATRFFALIGSTLMHAALITALGPWSLNHEWGVLIWNFYFIAQNILLFSRFSFAAQSNSITNANSRRALVAARVLMGLAILLPFLEPFGLFDAWPSWALYASQRARVRVFVDGDARDQLPTFLQTYIQAARFDDNRCLVRIDRWSLGTLHAPIYPADRFEFGVALAVAKLPGMQDKVHVEFESRANRWTGKRTMQSVSGEQELRAAAQKFWLNAIPRDFVAE